jgi:hypothetical protein
MCIADDVQVGPRQTGRCVLVNISARPKDTARKLGRELVASQGRRTMASPGLKTCCPKLSQKAKCKNGTQHRGEVVSPAFSLPRERVKLRLRCEFPSSAVVEFLC